MITLISSLSPQHRVPPPPPPPQFWTLSVLLIQHTARRRSSSKGRRDWSYGNGRDGSNIIIIIIPPHHHYHSCTVPPPLVSCCCAASSWSSRACSHHLHPWFCRPFSLQALCRVCDSECKSWEVFVLLLCGVGVESSHRPCSSVAQWWTWLLQLRWLHLWAWYLLLQSFPLAHQILFYF